VIAGQTFADLVTVNETWLSRRPPVRAGGCQSRPLTGRVGPSYRARVTTTSCSGYRFPVEIIQHAVWIYLRFTLSYRDVEGLLAARGIVVSQETVSIEPQPSAPSVLATLQSGHLL
jgi:hypothetical protein